MKRLVWLFALAGCPAESPFVVTDVHVAGRPVADALVGVYCAGTPRRDVLGVTGGSASRTDDAGRARLRLPYGAIARDCTVTVAKPGFATIESRGASACSSPATCPALAIDLARGAAIAPPLETEPGAPIDDHDDELASPPGDFARPPGDVARPPGDFARPPSPRSDVTPPSSPHAEVAR